MLAGMELRQLRCFVAVAEDKALEDEIGQCLLERQAPSIRLTPVGEASLREARELDLLNFIKQDLVPRNAMCDRVEMFERYIYDRAKAVFEHFDFPFDAEPPS
jgi:hypothetical protein